MGCLCKAVVVLIVMFTYLLTYFSPVLISPEYLESPLILDPVSRKNVAKTSFRIEDVKECLGWAFDFLQEQKISYDKNFSMARTLNLVYELLSI